MAQRGILHYSADHQPFIVDKSVSKRKLSGSVWEGYRCFDGQLVDATQLAVKDYRNNKPLILLSPVGGGPPEDVVEFYYNERLPDTLLSIFGHFSICVKGKVFNFSRVLRENEILSYAEYCYRPALGEYAAPLSAATMFGNFPGHGHFGRRFMRSIYVLRVRGLNTDDFFDYLMEKHQQCLEAPPDPKDSEVMGCFHFLSRNCATIVKDGLPLLGTGKVYGVLPRDFFVQLCVHFKKWQKRKAVPNVSDQLSFLYLPQLQVGDFPESCSVPLFNPFHWVAWMRLRNEFITVTV